MSVAELMIVLVLVTAAATAVAVAFMARLPWNKSEYAPAVSATSEADSARVSDHFIAALVSRSGDSLTVRPAVDGDGPAIRASIDEEVVQWMGWLETDLASERDWQRAPGEALRITGYLPVEETDTGRIVGVLNANKVNIASRSCDLGMWMGPEVRGTGLALEALELGLAVLHEGGIATVRITTAKDNKRMRRVAEQAGAVAVLEVENSLPNGEQVASVIYVHEA